MAINIPLLHFAKLKSGKHSLKEFYGVKKREHFLVNTNIFLISTYVFE